MIGQQTWGKSETLGSETLGRTGCLTKQVWYHKQVYLYILIQGQEVKNKDNNVAWIESRSKPCRSGYLFGGTIGNDKCNEGKDKRVTSK